MKRINQIREYRVMELEQSHVKWGAQEDFWEEVTSEQRHGCYEEPPGEHDSAKALGYKGDGGVQNIKKASQTRLADGIRLVTKLSISKEM